MTFPAVVVEALMGAGPFDNDTDRWLNLTGAIGSRASTPDHAGFAVTDLDIRFEVTFGELWIPAPGFNYEVIGQANAFATAVAWFVNIDAQGRLWLRWSTDGTTVLDVFSTAPIPVPVGRRLALRVTHDVDNGASGKTTTFYHSTSISGAWTQYSQVTTAATTSIFNSAEDLRVGDVTPGLGFQRFAGRCHAVDWRSTIGGATVLANPDFAAQSPGTTSFIDTAATPKTWTVSAPATIAGFTWTALSSRVFAADWTVGRQNELQPFPPGQADLELANHDRHLDPEHTGPHFGKLNPGVPFRIRSSSVALDLPGAVAATASTPDHASLAITDLDLRIRLSMDDWTPGGFGQRLVDQDGGAGNFGWAFAMPPGGTPQLIFSVDGTATLTRTATAATGFADGSDHWLRVTLDADNGAAGHDVRFYTSGDGAIWTQLGSTVTTAGTVTPFNSTAPLRVGGAVTELAGLVRTVELRTVIDGSVVANPDFAAQGPGVTSFSDAAGKVWTVNGTAAIALDPSVPLDQFYGLVEDGWEQIPLPPKDARCKVSLVDLLDVLDGLTLPDSAYDGEVQRLQPRASWRLDETEGTQMADSSGNGFHGTRDNGEPTDPLVFGGVKAFSAPHVGDNRGIFKGEGLPTGPPCTVVAWIKAPRDLAAVKTAWNVQRDNARGSALWVGIETTAGGSPNGEAVVNFFGLGTYKFRGHTRVDDDRVHQVVAVIAGTATSDIDLYVDGVVQTKTTITAGTGGTWPGHLWWTVGNTADITAGDFGLGGTIDDVSVYNRALTAADIATLYAAGTTAFDGDPTGTRIGRVLDIGGVPAALRDIAVGDTTMGPADYGGRSIAAYIAAVVESEQGYWHVAHHDRGRLKFRGRYARLTEPRSKTATQAFSDAAGNGLLRYERRGLDIDPNGKRSLVNVVKVAWRGGTETIQDADSVARYGPQGRTITTEAPTPTAARSAGNWLIARYGQPQTRVRGFETRPDADRTLWAAALAARVSDRVSFRRHPQEVGAAVTNELILEQISHSVRDGRHWTTKFRTSNADDTQVWIWGTSTWDETTAWG